MDQKTYTGKKKIAVLRARWHADIVDQCVNAFTAELGALSQGGCEAEVFDVPGAYEIPLAVSTILERGDYDGVVTVGAVIRGDTPHFEFVAGECSRGLMDVQLRHGSPVGFGVLTVNTTQQAVDRAGDGDDNKGYEATAAMLEMIRLQRSLT